MLARNGTAVHQGKQGRQGEMAKQTTVTYVDDVDGSPAEGTVTFGLDGKQYEIDLSVANSEKLRGILAPFVAAARRATGGARVRTASAAATRSTRPDREQTQAIREWATANGFDVAERGRISATVREAYEGRRKAATVTPIRQEAKAEEQSAPLDEEPAKPEKVGAIGRAKAKVAAAKAAEEKSNTTPGVKVLNLTAAQTDAIGVLRLNVHEVGTTYAVFDAATTDEALAGIQRAMEAWTGDKRGGVYKAIAAVVRKLQKADEDHVKIVEVEVAA